MMKLGGMLLEGPAALHLMTMLVSFPLRIPSTVGLTLAPKRSDSNRAATLIGFGLID
jgi:hypothetical protein